MLLSVNALAASGQINAAVNNIPIAFDSGDPGSLAVVCSFAQHVAIHNETAERIAWSFGGASVVSGYVVANTTMTKDGLNISNNSNLVIRSDSGAPIALGVVSVECW